MTYTINSGPQRTQKAPIAAPAKVLKKMTDEQRSGKVVVSDPEDPSISWAVYFGGGQVHYAQSIQGQGYRLNYMLNKHFPQLEMQYISLQILWNMNSELFCLVKNKV